MSNNVGFLKPVKKGDLEELHGSMTTLHSHFNLRLIPLENKTSDQFPDYKIYAVGSMGQETEIGAAWKKTKRKIGGVEFEFLSITIDDPSLPNTLNVAAFKNQQGGWDITWRRRQANKDAA